MANLNAPAGLVPVQYLQGNAWNGMARLYTIDKNDSNAYAPGDPVATATNVADIYGLSAVTLATAGTGNAIRGVAIAFGTGPVGSSATSGPFPGGPMVNPVNLATIIVPATKTFNYYALVVDDPSVCFEIQEIGTGTVLSNTVIGKNANLVSGTNNGFVSGWMLNNSGTATTSTLQLRVLQLVQRADNAPGQYQKWLCKINNHEFAAGTAGV
jgi:hypothetical protein